MRDVTITFVRGDHLEQALDHGDRTQDLLEIVDDDEDFSITKMVVHRLQDRASPILGNAQRLRQARG